VRRVKDSPSTHHTHEDGRITSGWCRRNRGAVIARAVDCLDTESPGLGIRHEMLLCGVG
jgi:hypothetical protein